MFRSQRTMRQARPCSYLRSPQHHEKVPTDICFIFLWPQIFSYISCVLLWPLMTVDAGGPGSACNRTAPVMMIGSQTTRLATCRSGTAPDPASMMIPAWRKSPWNLRASQTSSTHSSPKKVGVAAYQHNSTIQRLQPAAQIYSRGCRGCAQMLLGRTTSWPGRPAPCPAGAAAIERWRGRTSPRAPTLGWCKTTKR